MKIYEIITPEFEDKVVEEFLKTCLEMETQDDDDKAVIEACRVLLKFVEVPQ